MEPGFYSLNEEGIINTSSVKVTNNVNVNKSGTYKITYKYKDIVKERKVIVLEKVIQDEGTLTINLIGDKNITLEKGQDYHEPGCNAFYNKINLSNKITTESDLNINKVGTYRIKYTIIHNNQKKEVTRIITVIDNSLKIILASQSPNYTNQNVNINITVNGDAFSYIKLPDNKIVNDNKITYMVDRNGTYTFKAYNINNQEFTESITIQNIDKIPPTGTCQATINKQNTNIIVTANDNNNSIKYTYIDNNQIINTSTNNTYIYQKKSSKNVKVKLIDIANNETSITCQIIDNSYDKPILPSSNENIINKEETDTLKVYISKISSYYITRIWAYNPYLQLNKFDSPKYGSKLYKPGVLLEKAMGNNNLNNKLIIGFNASGFYLKDTYDASSVKKYSNYNKTSVGTLVITNGNVIRNVYDKAYKTWYIAGIDKNNTLRIFTDLKASSIDEINNKKTWAENIINSGVRNTFTFAAPLITNGQASDDSTNMPSPSTKKNRQAICQVNDNNFVLITGKDLNRPKLIDIMLGLNCKTGTNLDGGGSIALLFKNKGTSKITTIIGNERELSEVGYFTE